MASVSIPPDAIIAEEKLTRYLLQPRPWDDKSKFLARAGFHLGNPRQLEAAIRRLSAEYEAIDDGANPYGAFYRFEGPLEGPQGQSLQVIVIWLKWAADGSNHFVTLKPRRT